MKTSRALLAPVVAACVCAMACASGDDDHADQAGARPLTDIQCSVFYRESTTVPFVPENERVIVLGLGDSATETLGSYRFDASFLSDPYEGSSLVIDVGELHWLFQLRDVAPENQFIGGHGFTGLVYVSYPGTSEDLQFFCESL
jgi:hypothetical protein